MTRTIISIFITLLFFGCESNDTSIQKNIYPKAKFVNETGKKLFATQCASCHKVNVEMTGPALKNVESRWPDKKKLYAFIKNSTVVIATDNYAAQLFKNYNETVMPPHPDLNNNQIDSILNYIGQMSVSSPK